MDLYTFYLTIIVVIKIIYFIISLFLIYFTHKNNNKFIEPLTYWKHRMEFLFTILMSILLIILFNPLFNGIKLINKETQLLFFAYGLIVLINSQWDLFFKESKFYKMKI